jgi:hypothetical protein
MVQNAVTTGIEPNTIIKFIVTKMKNPISTAPKVQNLSLTFSRASSFKQKMILEMD